MDGPDRCAACAQALVSGGTVRLWDGNPYCRRCVDRTCPGLADYCASHNSFAETMPLAFWARLKSYLVAWAIIYVLGVLFVTFVSYKNGWAMPPWGVWLGFSIVWALAMVLYVSVDLWMAWRYQPTVIAEDGHIIVRTPRTGKEKRYSLGDVRWYVGTGHVRISPPWPRHVVVLDLPDLFLRRFRSGTYVSCGFTPDTKRMWEGFLSLAGVPQEAGRGRKSGEHDT